MTTPTELRQKLRGPIAAMTSHFKDDLSLDLDAMRRLTEFYVENGIPTVIVTGSTGEFFSMTDDERRAVIETVVKTADGKMTVIAGCAHSGTQLTIEMAKFAQDVGADGAMVTPPYYTYTGFDGLKTHYDLISQATDIGLVIYFSGAVMHRVADIIAKPEMMLELIAAGNGNVSAFKDASGNFAFHRDVCLLLDGKVAVMGSAGMNYTLWGYRFGSPCYLTGLGNIWPSVELDFFAALEQGHEAEAERIVKEKDLPYLAVCKETGRYWACVKHLQGLMGLPSGPMRPPMLSCTPEQSQEVARVCREIGLF